VSNCALPQGDIGRRRIGEMLILITRLIFRNSYCPMVTICTASVHYMYRQWSLYVTHSGHYMYHQWSLYVRPVVTICTASGHYMYRTVVTKCTASGQYMYRAVVTICTASGHYMYRPVVTICTASLTLNNSPFCPTQCVYVFCVDLRTNSHYFPIQH